MQGKGVTTMANEIGKLTIKQKLKACYKILFKNKPISTLTLGVRVIRCNECEYNLKCDDCSYKGIVEDMRKEGADNG
jgi:phage-related protein